MQKMSVTLNERLQETENERVNLEARLPALAAEKRAILGAAVVDNKTLARIEAEEAKIPVTLESLRLRLTELGKQIEEAVKAEAVHRVAEITQEDMEVTGRIAARREAFLHYREQMLALIREDYPDRQRHAELLAEAEYLRTAYDAPPAQVSTPLALNDHDLTPLRSEFQKRSWLSNAGQHWQEQTLAARQQQARDHRVAREQQQAHIVTSRPVTLYATAQED